MPRLRPPGVRAPRRAAPFGEECGLASTARSAAGVRLVALDFDLIFRPLAGDVVCGFRRFQAVKPARNGPRGKPFHAVPSGEVIVAARRVSSCLALFQST